MADESDVVTAFKVVMTQALYPAGIPTNRKSPPLNAKVILMGGWPLPADLDKAMAADSCVVSIFPRPDERNTSRLNQAYLPVSQATAGTTVAVAGNTATFGGAPAVGDLVAVFVRLADALDASSITVDSGVASQGYGYAINVGDTAAMVATALASQIPGATSSGGALTVPSGLVTATVTASWSVIQETSRQEKLFQVSLWAPTPSLRDLLAKTLRPALDLAYRLALADGTQMTTRYARSHQVDELQKQAIYQRHLFYFAEYATTTLPQSVPAVTIPVLSLTSL